MFEKSWINTQFLIDSGADISIVSIIGRKPLKASKSVNGIGGNQSIGLPSIHSIRFNCEVEKTYSIKLHQTVISSHGNLVILGRDFLSQFDSTEFDWKGGRIRLGDTWLFFMDSQTKLKNVNPELTKEQKSQILQLIDKFPETFADNPRAPRACNTVKHRIRTIDEKIVREKVRRLPSKWKEDIDKQVQEMLNNGIIEPSCSPFNSNPLLVSKKDNSKRFVIDFRGLNKTTLTDNYPLPNVQELLDQCYGCNFFSQLDMASGYWGIPIDEPDQIKTAFSVPHGKMHFMRMPFGLKNAQSTFQRNRDNIIEECKFRGAKGLDAYVDNCIIYTYTFEEHLKTLEILLQVLDEYNMSLRTDKCDFAYSQIEFLGFYVNGKSLKPAPSNIAKIQECPVPKSRKQLQAFLGMVNYNRRFIQSYSEICAPLNRMTSTKIPFSWTEEEQKAFDKVKLKFHSALSLFLPDWSKPFVLRTDASQIAVGSVLGQFNQDGSFQPIGYHSETLSKTARNWSTSERELYAIVSATRKWKAYCYDSVVVYSDHEPLKYIRSQKDPRGKIGRWILELENLDLQIKYLKGSDNVEADYMSRIPGSDIPSDNPSIYNINSTGGSTELIRNAQKNDETIQNAIDAIKGQLPLDSGPFKRYSNLNINNGLLCKGNRIMIPKAIAEQIIREYHGQQHPGVDNTTLQLTGRFYWQGMRNQIKKVVSECRSCIQCKHGTNPKAPIQEHRNVEKLFEAITMDIASMPTSLNGNSYFLLITDILSKLSTAIAMPNAKADTLIKSIWQHWFGYYGIPKSLQSDQGQNVDGNTVRKMCEDLAIEKLRSSAYHPAGNGSAERAIQSLKTLLRSMCNSRNISIHQWDQLLPEAILNLNNTTNASSKFSPFEIAYGMPANTVLDNKLGVNGSFKSVDKAAVRLNAVANKMDASNAYRGQANKVTKVNEYKVGDHVLLKRTHGEHPKLNPFWVGPYQVEKKIGPVNWGIIDAATGKSKVVHHDLLKPAGKETNAQLLPHSTQTTKDPVNLSKIHIIPHNHGNPGMQINREQFTSNVFSNPINVPVPSAPSVTQNVTTSRQGRIIKAPIRLGINDFY